MRIQVIRMIDANNIKKQAEIIRDIAQAVIDACENEEKIDAFARNKISGGLLAQDSAVLALQILEYEMKNK